MGRLNPQTNLLELTDNPPRRLRMEIASNLSEPQTAQALLNLNTLTENSDPAFPRTINLQGSSFNYVGNASFELQDDSGTVLTVSSSSPAQFTIKIDRTVLAQNQTKEQILRIIQNIKTYRHVTRLIKSNTNVTAVSDHLDQFNLKTERIEHDIPSSRTLRVEELKLPLHQLQLQLQLHSNFNSKFQLQLKKVLNLQIMLNYKPILLPCVQYSWNQQHTKQVIYQLYRNLVSINTINYYQIKLL